MVIDITRPIFRNAPHLARIGRTAFIMAIICPLASRRIRAQRTRTIPDPRYWKGFVDRPGPRGRIFFSVDQRSAGEQNTSAAADLGTEVASEVNDGEVARASC